MRIPGVFSFPLLLISGLFLFFGDTLLMAQNTEASQEGYITALSVSGLKRTKRSTAEKPLRQFIGREAAQVDPDEVRAVILATGILEPLSVEIADGILSVEVREKWAIFPIPVVMAGSGGMMGGLAFFDANAFGLNDKFFLAGMYHSNGWMASAGYIHSSPGGRIPGWNGISAFTREERYDRDQNNEDLRWFDLDSISLSAGLNFPLLKDSDLLSASTSVSYNQKILRNQEQAFNGPDDGLRLFGLGGEISLRRNTWDGIFLSQEGASLRYSYRMAMDGFSFQSLRFRGTWEKSIVPGFRFTSQTGIVFEPQAPVLFESSPSAAQVAILPRYFSAQNYAGVSGGLEKSIVKMSVGVLSLAAAYQVVFSKGSVLGDSLDHGVVGMLTFYLSRVAIPALGLGAAYNVDKNYLQGSFSLGMSF